MLKELYNRITEEDFEDLFQPISGEELAVRQKERLAKILHKGTCTENEDGTWSCTGDVDLSYMGLTNVPVKFKVVRGYFTIHKNNLISLEGSPKDVGKQFVCSNNLITSLQGGPWRVGQTYYCNDNLNLVSFEGVPEFPGGSVYLSSTPLGDKLDVTSIPSRHLKHYIEKWKAMK